MACPAILLQAKSLRVTRRQAVPAATEKNLRVIRRQVILLQEHPAETEKNRPQNLTPTDQKRCLKRMRHLFIFSYEIAGNVFPILCLVLCFIKKENITENRRQKL